MDEIAQIKRAMSETKLRKNGDMHLNCEIYLNENRVENLQEIINTQRIEIYNLKVLLTQANVDLRECSYENKKLVALERELTKEFTDYKITINENFDALKTAVKENYDHSNEKSRMIEHECDLLNKIVTSIRDCTAECNNMTLKKTSNYLVDNAIKGIQNIRQYANNTSQSLKHVDGDDFSLLDMCRTLEEENITLTQMVESFRTEVGVLQKDINAQRLIPHYRLAILRTRSYASNLSEQLKREKTLSQSLRHQLELSHIEIKKVINEKNNLYSRLSNEHLQEEEKYLKTHPKIYENKKVGIQVPSSELGMNEQVIFSKENFSNNGNSSDSQEIFMKNQLNYLTNDVLLTNKGKEMSTEIVGLDRQIDILKQSLEKAALSKSHEIITTVLSSSLNRMTYL